MNKLWQIAHEMKKHGSTGLPGYLNYLTSLSIQIIFPQIFKLEKIQVLNTMDWGAWCIVR